MFQLLVSIDVDMIVNVSGGERRPDGDVRFEDDEGDESCERDKTNWWDTWEGAKMHANCWRKSTRAKHVGKIWWSFMFQELKTTLGSRVKHLEDELAKSERAREEMKEKQYEGNLWWQLPIWYIETKKWLMFAKTWNIPFLRLPLVDLVSVSFRQSWHLLNFWNRMHAVFSEARRET